MDTIEALGDPRVTYDSIGRLEWEGGERDGAARLVQLKSGQVLLEFRAGGSGAVPGNSPLSNMGATTEGSSRIIRAKGELLSGRMGNRSHGLSYLDVVMSCEEASVERDSLAVDLGLQGPIQQIEAVLANYFSGAARTITVPGQLELRLEPTVFHRFHPFPSDSVRRAVWTNFETHRLTVQAKGRATNAPMIVDAACAALMLETGESVGMYQADIHLLNGETITILKSPNLRSRASAPLTIGVDVSVVTTNLIQDPGIGARCIPLIGRFVDACDRSSDLVTRGLIAATLIDDMVPRGAQIGGELKAAAAQIRTSAKDSVADTGLSPTEVKRLERSVADLLRPLGTRSFRERLNQHLTDLSIISSSKKRQAFAKEIVSSRNALVHNGHYDPNGRSDEVQWRALVWMSAALIAREAGQHTDFDETPERLWPEGDE